MHVSSLAIYLSTIALAVGLLNERAISLAKELQSPNFIPYTPENTADRGKRDVQEPLLLQKDVATLSKHHTARLDIHSDSFLGLIPFYWTNIALGTPNQAFRMIIDLSYAGAVVRAPNCTDPFPGCDAGFIYYHNQSSTYRPEYEHFSIPLPGHTVAGTVSTDHMQLIDLNITDVTFGEVDDIHGENWLIMSMTAHADGAIGLMPPNASMPVYTDTKLPNLLQKVISQDILEKNIMTFDLAPVGERGSLYLGTTPEEAANNDQTHIPLSHQTNRRLQGTWHTKIDSVSVTGNNSTTIPMNDTYAVFDLGAGLQLPEDVFNRVAANIGLDLRSGPYPHFNCSHWDDMPDIILTLAGQDIAISVEDYGELLGYWGDKPFCGSKVMPIDFIRPDIVAVGPELLQRKYYVAFDVDEDEITLIEREP